MPYLEKVLTVCINHIYYFKMLLEKCPQNMTSLMTGENKPELLLESLSLDFPSAVYFLWAAILVCKAVMLLLPPDELGLLLSSLPPLLKFVLERFLLAEVEACALRGPLVMFWTFRGCIKPLDLCGMNIMKKAECELHINF